VAPQGNGGSNHNVTHNLIVNVGTAIVNIAESVASSDIARLPKIDNGTACCRGSKADYIWNTEQQLGVQSFEEIFQSPFAKRWPSFAEQLRYVEPCVSCSPLDTVRYNRTSVVESANAVIYSRGQWSKPLRWQLLLLATSGLTLTSLE
jgi:hypothetical protein